jgi:hypothetical protein
MVKPEPEESSSESGLGVNLDEEMMVKESRSISTIVFNAPPTSRVSVSALYARL